MNYFIGLHFCLPFAYYYSERQKYYTFSNNNKTGVFHCSNTEDIKFIHPENKWYYGNDKILKVYLGKSRKLSEGTGKVEIQFRIIIWITLYKDQIKQYNALTNTEKLISLKFQGKEDQYTMEKSRHLGIKSENFSELDALIKKYRALPDKDIKRLKLHGKSCKNRRRTDWNEYPERKGKGKNLPKK